MNDPMVVTELACGTPAAPRGRTLADLETLPQSRQASLVEVRERIERERLFGLGCGLVNLALLASAMLTPGAQLWTLDQRLRLLAERFQIAHLPIRHQTRRRDKYIHPHKPFSTKAGAVHSAKREQPSNG